MAFTRPGQRMQGRTAQTQRVTPRMVKGGILLQMPSEELVLHIEEESASNPALEIVRDSACPTCGRDMSGSGCWYCRSIDTMRITQAVDDAVPLSRLRFPNTTDDEEFDLLDNAPIPFSLQDYVLQQARLVMPHADFAIAEHLVSDLNENGLLQCDAEEAARLLDVSAERVREVLSRLQTLDPPGVCAQSVQECALIQLRELAAQADVPDLVSDIVLRHWEDLANHAYGRIQRELDATPEEVEDAVRFIRENLHPYPGRLYCSPHPGRRQPGESRLRPDVIIHRDGADYTVEIVRPFDFELRVSAAYQRLAAQARTQKTDSPEYRLALEQCRRATWLVESLAQREQTLRQIAEYAVGYQRPFLDTESEEKMKKLTRADVADHIGKHSSTVSRAVANKYVALPNTTLVPFGKFFTPAAAQKTVIAEVLSKEDPQHPLTDEQICRILRVRGFSVARRTVAKYRLALRIPNSTRRGRH